MLSAYQAIYSNTEYIMQKIIDLDCEELIDPKELASLLYLKEIIFQLTPDANIEHKIHAIDRYIPLLYAVPTIKTNIRVKNYEAFAPVFPAVAIGGTFDHFHLGHQVLLLYSVLSASKEIRIGLSGPALLLKKKSKIMLEPWLSRMKTVKAFVNSIKPDLETIIFELKDGFGVTIEIEEIDAVVVSEETLKGGEQINHVRAERSMKPLKLIVCPTVSPKKDIENKLSSSTIREYLLSKNCLSIQLYGEYKGYFQELTASLGVAKEKAEEWWDCIFWKYSEHWRFYHTNQHILRLLQQWRGPSFAKQRDELSKKEMSIIELATWFHDVIYQPNLADNQEQSAKLALTFLDQALQASEAASLSPDVQRLILQTKNHVPSCKLSQVLYDLDMGILDSEEKYYKQYARAIKKEYAPLVGQQYAPKRISLLQKWKDSKPLFSFQPHNMQSNLAWEIYCLENHDL